MMDDRDNSPAETETWRLVPSTDPEWVFLDEWDGGPRHGPMPRAFGDAILDARAKAGRVRQLEAALLEASYGPNFGDSHCWCHEDYCIQIPSPRDHSARCKRIRAALLAPTPTEGSSGE